MKVAVLASGSSGNADLYVKLGSEPTTTDYDCLGNTAGSNETCSFATPSSGTWHVMVRAESAFSNLSVEGSYEEGGGGGVRHQRPGQGLRGVADCRMG